MLGTVFGDIVGCVYEWQNAKTKTSHYRRQEHAILMKA